MNNNNYTLYISQFHLTSVGSVIDFLLLKIILK